MRTDTGARSTLHKHTRTHTHTYVFEQIGLERKSKRLYISSECIHRRAHARTSTHPAKRQYLLRNSVLHNSVLHADTHVHSLSFSRPFVGCVCSLARIQTISYATNTDTEHRRILYVLLVIILTARNNRTGADTHTHTHTHSTTERREKNTKRKADEAKQTEKK